MSAWHLLVGLVICAILAVAYPTCLGRTTHLGSDGETASVPVADGAAGGPGDPAPGPRAEGSGPTGATGTRPAGTVPSRFGSVLGFEALRRVPSVDPDGWIGKEAALPLTIPWFRGTLRIDAHLPEGFDSAKTWLEVLLGDRRLGTYRIVPGEVTTIRIPLEGRVEARGDQWITLRPGHTFRAREVDLASVDERDLGVILLRAEVVPPAPDDERRRILDIDASGDGNGVGVVVDVVDADGRPRAGARVSAYRPDGPAQERRSDAQGRVVFDFDGNPPGPGDGDGAVFVELLDGDARLGSVRQRQAARPGQAPSWASSQRLRSRPPAWPASEPSAAITRWHGTMIARGLWWFAWPTARAARGLPAAQASSRYEAVVPCGIPRSAFQTRRWNGVPRGRRGSASQGSFSPSK